MTHFLRIDYNGIKENGDEDMKRNNLLAMTAVLFIAMGAASLVSAAGCVQVVCTCAQTKLCISTKNVNSQMYPNQNPGQVCDDRCRRAFPGFMEVSCKATCTKYQ